ncbi:peroxiredoxin-like family protein [Rhodohalobacter sp. 614A]|uniref:peroxiredoxin-like family protein n=1 Tax=Rhodohalobacter sp. 614A TaxID=2908649 RepID=UPI001F3B2A74|nr:peroxiredoxin-like family protein [Rhodohalobacter sp. 614A]
MKIVRYSLFLTIFTIGCNSHRIPENASQVAPLEVGQTVPDVILTNSFGHETDLHEIVSERPTLLIFYRGGWCPYCNAHLSQLAKIEAQLYDMGVQIVGISPDRPEYLKESTMEHELSYQLLSDREMNAAKEFGVAFRVDSTTINRYKNGGLDLAERAGEDHYLLPVPAAFLVDTTGTIHYRYFNTDCTVRVGNDELLTASKELMN